MPPDTPLEIFCHEIRTAECLGSKLYSEIVYFKSLMRTKRIMPWEAHKALVNYFGLSVEDATRIVRQHYRTEDKCDAT